MIDKIKHIFHQLNNSADKSTPEMKISKIVFELKYKDMPVGFLEFSDAHWSFYYSESFKNQNEIAPILSFPDKSKKYEGTELWSFFTSRIPDNTSSSEKKPERVASVKESNENLIQQLKSYGRKTITNPFDLSVAY